MSAKLYLPEWFSKDLKSNTQKRNNYTTLWWLQTSKNLLEVTTQSPWYSIWSPTAVRVRKWWKLNTKNPKNVFILFLIRGQYVVVTTGWMSYWHQHVVFVTCRICSINLKQPFPQIQYYNSSRLVSFPIWITQIRTRMKELWPKR